MSEINIFNCTLRSGGYVNNWKFDIGNIEMIKENRVEFVELGYLT